MGNLPQIIVSLQIEPTFRGRIRKGLGKSKGHVRRNGLPLKEPELQFAFC